VVADAERRDKMDTCEKSGEGENKNKKRDDNKRIYSKAIAFLSEGRRQKEQP
jgi:hypothetical protein